MRNIRKENQVILLAPVAILAISTASIFIRFAQQTLPSLTIAAYRMGLASLFMVPFSFRKTIHDLRRNGKKQTALLLLSGLLLALHFASWIVSLRLTSVINSVVLVTTTPIWVAMVSPLITKEEISRRFWFGLLMAVMGMGIVSGILQSTNTSIEHSDAELRLLGNGLALFGAFCAAGYVIIGRILRNSFTNDSYTFGVYTVAAICLFLFTYFYPTVSLRIDLLEFKWLVLLALIPQILGHSLINWFLGFIPAHLVALFLLGEPIGSTVLAMIVLGEYPSRPEIIGAVIILIGISISVSGNKSA